MTTDTGSLPASVRTITTSDGKVVYLVGTAHVSKKSVDDVRATVAQVNPDAIAVELCESRYKSLIRRDAWKNMDIFKVVKEKKAVFLLAQLVMSSFYRKLGDQLDVKPGAEMIEGVNLAEERGAALVLADRDIEITLRRVWGHLNFFNKMKMAAQLFTSLLMTEKIDAALVEDLKNRDQLEDALALFAKTFPEVKKRLIDERDIYLSRKIREAPGHTVVAVVGAGHVEGIITHIESGEPLEPLMQTPPKSLAPAIIAWSIPALIIVLLCLGFFKGGFRHSLDSLYIWVLLNGTLAALGAAIALAHPLTVISSFLAAPLTSLNPMIAAGWVSGLVQAMVKKPMVKDMEDLPNAIASVRGFWKNPVSRILLVVVLTNVGSSLGTFIAGGWIAGRLF